MKWILLAVAIISEVGATLSIRASNGYRRWRWIPVVIAGYLLAFSAFSVSLKAGMPLGIGYGVWGAAGVALTAVISRLVFHDAMSKLSWIGIMLVTAGVAVVNFGAVAMH
jgi:small multidrug resistance pump